MDKINALSLAEKLIGGGAVLMLLASLFGWWSVSGRGFSVSENGLGQPGSIWSILAIFISVGLAAVTLVPKLTTIAMPALPESVTWGMVHGGGGALVVVLMLLKAWRISAVPVGGFGIGFFIAIVAAAAIAYGGYLLYSEEKARAP